MFSTGHGSHSDGWDQESTKPIQTMLRACIPLSIASQLEPLNLRLALADRDGRFCLFIIIIPSTFLDAFLEINLKRRTALLACSEPFASEVESGKLETAAVERDKGCVLPVLGGVWDWGSGFGGCRGGDERG